MKNIEDFPEEINCRRCNLNKNKTQFNISSLRKSDYICRICLKEARSEKYDIKFLNERITKILDGLK